MFEFVFSVILIIYYSQVAKMKLDTYNQMEATETEESEKSPEVNVSRKSFDT